MTGDPGLAAWLSLCLTPGLGASTIRRLLQEFGLPENILSADTAAVARIAGDAAATLKSGAAQAAVQRALQWSAQGHHHIVTLADTSYPRLLLEIPDPPPLLYARGNVDLLGRPALAVVGSRNGTAQGLRNAEAFARTFSEGGLTIVSGLALGIDAAAHRGGLAGAGSTIAVLGTGIDVVYPKSNAALFAEIAARGLLLSEYPLGTPSVAHNFPRRNRLISGMSRGCLVVEAAIGSGSLITARLAAEQGREVFAIPGSIHSPLSRGCHSLIKQGAKLVDAAEDVLAEFGSWQHASTAAPASRPDTGLLAHMGFDPVDIDALCARAGLPAETVAAELLRLELDGLVATLPGGRFQRLS
ncbi:MAG: DNA-protecting protein DprA [Proteobacteria bacterium]|nr:DNA-protecting protein DprA [Pseudomonadota bacterium]